MSVLRGRHANERYHRLVRAAKPLGGFAHTVRVTTQRARAQLRHAEIDQAHRAQLVALTELGLPEGMAIRVDGERGVFLVRGLGTDGSITCVGGESGHWRSFRPEWCYPATRINRRGRSVPNTLPVAQRGLRQEWLRQRGLGRDLDLVNDDCP